MKEQEQLVERVHGEVLFVYTDGHDHTVSDLYYHARRIIALVEQSVATRLLDYKTLNVGVEKSFDRPAGARNHLIRAVVPMLDHIGIKPIGLTDSDMWKAKDMLDEFGISGEATDAK